MKRLAIGAALLGLSAAAACGKKSVGDDDVVAYLQHAPEARRDALLARAGVDVQPKLPERTDLVGRGGNPLTLVGRQPEVGEVPPDFTVRDGKLGEVHLADYRGKVLVLSVVPSLDTRVCETQTHHLTDAETTFPPDTKLLTVSRDLPFAQTRFLEEARIQSAMGSDYHGGDFGRAWGLEVKESGLLARSVWVIGRDGKVAYRELVADQGTEPDYDSLLAAVTTASQ